MRFKLDENPDVHLAALLAEGGHDTATVLSQGMSGRSDEVIYETCVSEQRTLVTLDLDLANPLRFPPGATEGIAVLRPRRPVLPAIREMLAAARGRPEDGAIRGSLWIVGQAASASTALARAMAWHRTRGTITPVIDPWVDVISLHSDVLADDFSGDISPLGVGPLADGNANVPVVYRGRLTQMRRADAGARPGRGTRRRSFRD